jgi:hypothetical protein
MTRAIADMNGWEAFLETFSDDLIREFNTISEAEFAFVGANPVELVNSLMSMEKDKDVFKKDMALFIVIGATRGTNTSKMVNRMSDDGKAKLMSLVAKYGVVAHKKDVPMKTPTLPRMMALFPGEIYSYRRTKGLKPLGTVPRGFDSALCFPGGAALIKPTNVLGTDDWLKWYESFCKIVGIVYNKDNALLSQRFSFIPDLKKVL